VTKLYQSLITSGTENCGFEGLIANDKILYSIDKNLMKRLFP